MPLSRREVSLPERGERTCDHVAHATLPLSLLKRNQREAPITSSDIDRDLFTRLMRGDNEALAQLFTRHNYRIYLYCLKIVSDPFEAEDITQRMWERLLKLRAGTDLPDHNEHHIHIGLLITIARNLCLDYLRCARRFDPLDHLVESLHPRSDEAEHFHLEDFLAIALARLPLPYREVVVLREYSGYSYDEIAEMLGEKVTAVRMRASRARSCLARVAGGMMALEEE